MAGWGAAGGAEKAQPRPGAPGGACAEQIGAVLALRSGGSRRVIPGAATTERKLPTLWAPTGQVEIPARRPPPGG